MAYTWHSGLMARQTRLQSHGRRALPKPWCARAVLASVEGSCTRMALTCDARREELLATRAPAAPHAKRPRTPMLSSSEQRSTRGGEEHLIGDIVLPHRVAIAEEGRVVRPALPLGTRISRHALGWWLQTGCRAPRRSRLAAGRPTAAASITGRELGCGRRLHRSAETLSPSKHRGRCPCGAWDSNMFARAIRTIRKIRKTGRLRSQ